MLAAASCQSGRCSATWSSSSSSTSMPPRCTCWARHTDQCTQRPVCFTTCIPSTSSMCSDVSLEPFVQDGYLCHVFLLLFWSSSSQFGRNSQWKRHVEFSIVNSEAVVCYEKINRMYTYQIKKVAVNAYESVVQTVWSVLNYRSILKHSLCAQKL